jgi:hypothetical protein
LSAPLHRLAVLAVALAACGGSTPQGRADAGSVGQNPLCITATTDPPEPLAHIGPDVSAPVPCAGIVLLPVASFSNTGGDGFRWTATLQGDANVFSLPRTESITCFSGGVDIVTVQVATPPAAVPGDAFDAMVTISSPDGLFPQGQVAIHVTVASTAFELVPEVLDFGTLALGGSTSRTLAIHNPSSTGLVLTTDQQMVGPFTFRTSMAKVGPGMTPMLVLVNPMQAGDFDVEASWTAAIRPDAPPACRSTKTIRLRAHVVAPDGGGP